MDASDDAGMVEQLSCPVCGEGAFYEVRVFRLPKVIEPVRNLVFVCPNNCQDDPVNLAVFWSLAQRNTGPSDDRPR